MSAAEFGPQDLLWLLRQVRIRLEGREERQVPYAVSAAPLPGSNQLLSLDELAAYLGVPKRAVYDCWRRWGLRGYRVGRHLRFREPHVEEWLQNQEA